MSNDKTTQGKGTRDSRKLLPFWRITGKVTLITPLSIGTGLDVKSSDVADSPYVIAIARDVNEKPYIAGSSFKGALNALAKQVDMDAKIRECLFGTENGSTTTASMVEFCNLYLPKDTSPQPSELLNADQYTANIPHVVIDRDYGSAKEGLLFLKQVVPPAYTFEFECTAREIAATDIQALLGLLICAGDENSPLRLGSGKAADNGKISWSLKEIRQIEDVSALLKLAKTTGKNSAIDLWKNANEVKLTATTIQHNPASLLDLGELTLNFHTPFLVYEKQNKNGNDKLPDGKPRQNHKGCGVLPASSLHGALRSQAERILRTVGEETPFGYKVAAVADVGGAKKLDLASVLFGAPGWQSVIRISDFVEVEKKLRIKHEMVAIDRVTGGGKDGAKFSIEVLDCPRLKGSISVDIRRLTLLGEASAKKAIGLLAHVLRDLDESDIPLGYGVAKGYGRTKSESLKKLESAMSRVFDVTKQFAVNDALVEFSTIAKFKQTRDTLHNSGAKPDFTKTTKSEGDFHNPYVFIPFGKADTKNWQAYDAISTSHHSHALYLPNTFNGRLVCKLTTTTPIFIGAGDAAEQANGQPTIKKNFKLNNEIALPATSLRGMISSLHESITQSQMRVYEDGNYSMRNSQLEKSLSAVGRLIQVGDRIWMQLLALPTLNVIGERATVPNNFSLLLPKENEFPAPLKALFGDNQNNTPEAMKTFSGANVQNWFLDNAVNAKIKRENSGMVLHLANPDAFHRSKNNHFLLGLKVISAKNPQLSTEGMSSPMRGILRLTKNLLRDLPSNKTHEMFIPFDKEAAKVLVEIRNKTGKSNLSEITQLDLDKASIDLQKNFCLLEVPQVVIDRFKRLANERTDSQKNDPDLNEYQLLPYHPKDTKRNLSNDPDKRYLEPKHGDLVFFRPNADGTKIAEIAYSSNWRVELPNKISDWLGAAQTEAQKSENLSPSELLFGKVEVRDNNVGINQSQEKIKAFASKVHIGFGYAATAIQPENAVHLRILASPKPPSPSMYFFKTGDEKSYVSKANLATNPNLYQIKGRKQYLHAQRDALGKVKPLPNRNGMPWESRYPDPKVNNQKVRITPIGANNSFYFSVDFKNLTQDELATLCAAIRPADEYQHKLGMGKPLGLGSVKIDFAGLFLVDRNLRYTQTKFTDAPRYTSCWKQNEKLPEPFQLESKAAATQPVVVSPEALATSAMFKLKTTQPEVFAAITLAGNPAAVNLPVYYPQRNDKLRFAEGYEKETFLWFVKNDSTAARDAGTQQNLATFTAETTSLPALKGD
jgi:CRISPR-associated protein (TIGR03986 family)